VIEGGRPQTRSKRFWLVLLDAQSRFRINSLKLLTETDMKIIQISTELGYNTQAYFWRFSKKNAGVGPQEFGEANNAISMV